MTEAERQMMNTIHFYGLILSLDSSTMKIALERIEAILEDAHKG